MNDPVLKLNLLVRAELALARIQARRAGSRLILSLVALVFVLLGVGMLNLAMYQAFAGYFSPAISGLFVALINLFLAAVLFMIAGKSGNETNEEKMAQEIRNLAYSSLSSDLDGVKSEFSKVSEDVKRIRSGFGSLTGSAGSIMPIMGLLTKAVAKRKYKISERKNEKHTEDD